jgi:two-component system chemotaxis response regulator CheB
MIRVLVAEDSLTTRRLLVEILRSDPEIEIAGEASDGVEAVEMTKRLRPAVVTMDIKMPRMDGFEATRQIMVEAPTPIVIVSASVNIREVEVSMHALRAGALTVLPKPAGPEAADFEAQRRRFVDMVKAMSDVKLVRRRAEPRAAQPLPLPPTAHQAPARLVAVAASTGGPPALARILAELPEDFALPILVVQHISQGFVGGLARWLNTAGALPVKVAEDGEPLRPRTVYLAPDDRHLGVTYPGMIRLSDTAPVEGFRPSASVLFESVAKVVGASAVALVLTGMGCDGLDGLHAIRRAGGRIIAQDEPTSVVFGMNGAAVASGLADLIVPLDALAFRLEELSTR